MKRRFAASAVIVAAILATGGTALAASNLKTVSQKAAEASPPPPSDITAVVAKRQLFDTAELTCKAGYGSEEPVYGAGKSPLVLTDSPLKEGDAIGDATLLGEINGSPIFSITGAFPLYRDLKLKDSGPDVRMVNDALVRAGLLLQQEEPAAATVTVYTSAAIGGLYKQAGYAASKADDVVIPSSAFQVISAPGTVSGKVHSTGLLESEPIATIGIGARGLLCTGAGGTVPTEAKDDQLVRIPALGKELFPMTITTRTTTPPSGSPLPGNSSEEDLPTGSTMSAAGKATTAIFVDCGDTVPKTNVVAASLILAQSASNQLVVPSSSLWTRDGQSHVTVQDASGDRDVPVKVTFSAGGENTVSPVTPTSTLAAGDKVVVEGVR